ncbi:MAG: asparagine synthetase B family protein [Verrucomicrobiales bacterium]
MCGIVAFLSLSEPVAMAAQTGATAALHHRGPDNRRQWLSPDGRVGLGHARLSIIDLTGGDQPIASEDESLHIVVNGEFYDHEAFYLGTTGFLPVDRSLFHGVFQVPPGHYLLATPGSFRVLRYWDFNYPTATALASNPQDDAFYIEYFRAKLNEAVRLRMRADVPVGYYLSGGMDSCAVLGLAARHAREPIHAFTLSFDQAAYDESSSAQEMAAHAGARYYPIPIKHSDLADHFADAIWHAETLCSNGHGISKYLLSRAVRDAGYKVVFTGEHGDGTFHRGTCPVPRSSRHRVPAPGAGVA